MMVKKFTLLTLFLLILAAVPEKVLAQNADQIPPFSMMLSNGGFFKAADLSKNKPLVLIYFAPDCDHCHTFMNAFFKKAAEFKNAEVVMVTYKPVNEVAAFERSWQTSQYANLKVGTEGSTNFLRLFYKLQQTPFAALYNRQGKLINSYRKDIPITELIKKVKTL